MSTSSFLYRDVIKYIIPTLLFLILATSLVPEEIDLPPLITFGIIISLLFGAFISTISNWFFRLFPDVRRVISIAQWMNSNWDYRKMFYYIHKEERDYLYLTGAYIEFFKNSACILVVFALTWFGKMLWDTHLQWDDLLRHSILLAGSIKLNTLVIITLCIVLFFILKKALIFETKILLFPNGQYDIFSEKIQRREKEIIARSIYGKIGDRKGVEIELYSGNTLLSSCTSLDFGYWSVPLKKEFLNIPLEIRTTLDSKKIRQNILVKNYNKPYIEIELAGKK